VKSFSVYHLEVSAVQLPSFAPPCYAGRGFKNQIYGTVTVS